MSQPSFRTMVIALGAGVMLSAVAADAGLDLTKSSLVATFKQSGVAVDAPFKVFRGTINYQPDNLANTAALIEVTTASLDLGDPGYSSEVRKKAWFDSAVFPTATFRATSVKADGPGRLSATGTFTLKGRTQTLTVPITVRNSAAGTAFDGNITISRKAFGIGDASWEDVLDDQVKVRFHLVNR